MYGVLRTILHNMYIHMSLEWWVVSINPATPHHYVLFASLGTFFTHNHVLQLVALSFTLCV